MFGMFDNKEIKDKAEKFAQTAHKGILGSSLKSLKNRGAKFEDEGEFEKWLQRGKSKTEGASWDFSIFLPIDGGFKWKEKLDLELSIQRQKHIAARKVSDNLSDFLVTVAGDKGIRVEFRVFDVS
tara:strand:- start:369 stop:743 length:375 start_codon:yes stop_codon:yes gene_type:complete